MKKKKVFKKKLEDFIKDESGNISRENVLKIGLGTITALGIAASFWSEAGAGHSSNSQDTDPKDGLTPTANCIHGSHTSHHSY